MTVIAGIATGRAVWMASDSFGGHSDMAMTVARPKIFERSVPNTCGPQPILFGCSGDFRGQDLLEEFELPAWGSVVSRPTPKQYLVLEFVPALRVFFEQHGYMSKKDGKDAQALNFLIGYEGRLFSCWGEWDLFETRCGYAAIGCGYLLALGALHATRFQEPPPDRLVAAMEAAAAHSPYVSLPFHILKVVASGAWGEAAAEPLELDRPLVELTKITNSL